MKLLVNVPLVGADGIEADSKLVCDFFVKPALGKKSEHFVFAGTEVNGA